MKTLWFSAVGRVVGCVTMLERNGPPEDRPRECAIANALGVLGDRWSLLVLREIGLGVHRFTEMKRKTGAPSDILAARLRKLESFGVIERHRYSERPPRNEYVLTASGADALPVLDALRAWGEAHQPPRRPGVTLQRRQARAPRGGPTSRTETRVELDDR